MGAVMECCGFPDIGDSSPIRSANRVPAAQTRSSALEIAVMVFQFRVVAEAPKRRSSVPK